MKLFFFNMWHICLIWERYSKIKICVIEENKSRLHSGKAFCEAVQNVMSCRLLSASTEVKIYVILIVSVVCVVVNLVSLPLKEKHKPRALE